MGTITNDTNDVIANEQFFDLPDDNYILQTVDLNNILDDLHITEDDRIITKSIILNLEADIADSIKAGLIASLPTIGTLQRNLVRDRLKEHNKELQLARATMSKEEYKEYAKEVRRQVKQEIKDEYNLRTRFKRLCKSHKKKYEKYLITFGKGYANLYINSMFWLKPIEYNQEVQDQYDRINGTHIE